LSSADRKNEVLAQNFEKKIIALEKVGNLLN